MKIVFILQKVVSFRIFIFLSANFLHDFEFQRVKMFSLGFKNTTPYSSLCSVTLLRLFVCFFYGKVGILISQCQAVLCTAASTLPPFIIVPLVASASATMDVDADSSISQKWNHFSRPQSADTIPRIPVGLCPSLSVCFF